MTGGIADRGPRRIDIPVAGGGYLTLYANARVVRALEHISADMNLYDGVRLFEVIEAAYLSGVKDGMGEVISRLDPQTAAEIGEELNYRHPGRPPLG